MTITKDTIIGDILNIAPQTAPLFMNIGMHCLAAPLPGVRPWSRPHGSRGGSDELLAAVNKMIAEGE